MIDDLKSVVSTEEEAMNRFHAFFMTLEFLNICEFNMADGPLKYYEEITESRALTP